MKCSTSVISIDAIVKMLRALRLFLQDACPLIHKIKYIALFFFEDQHQFYCNCLLTKI